jgi:hypothetical protein
LLKVLGDMRAASSGTLGTNPVPGAELLGGADLGDTAEVLEPVKCSFDAPAKLVEALAEAERLLPVAPVWNDRPGSAFILRLAAARLPLRPIGRAGIAVARAREGVRTKVSVTNQFILTSS